MQFALAAGGEAGTVPFRGVGYTPNPTEKKNARIINLKASMMDDVCFAAMAVPEWEPGTAVRWAPVLYGQDAGRGTIVEVIIHGSVTRHGMTNHATPADPLLDIKVHGKNLRVIRHAGSLRSSGIPA